MATYSELMAQAQTLMAQAEQVRKQAPLRALVSEAQHVAHTRGRDLAFLAHVCMGNRLVKNGEAIANRTFGCIGNNM